ncbi:MAG: (2Fe-2S)-binding protein [Burkholderiaceae bacterium]
MGFNLNGAPLQTEVDPAMPLLWVLRDELNLTGTKFGCGVSACGACTVLLDGQAVRTCVLPVSAVAGRRVTTIELSRPNAESDASPTQLDAIAADQQLILQTLQAAWIEEQVPQCGYCQSGMLMAATSLLGQHAAPSEQQISQAMANLCRCGTYQRVRRAIDNAAGKLAEKSA